MSTQNKPPVLLWNSRSTVALCAAAVIVTIGIVVFQMGRRTGLLDPSMVTIFYRLFLFEDYPASFLFLAALLIGLIPWLQGVAVAVARLVDRHVVVVAAAAFVALAAASYWVYDATPLAMDEYVPYVQSQVFAAGRLLGQYPPQLVDWLFFPSFQGHFVYVSKVTGEFGSAYWPGFALLLTPFTLVGLPWLCNPMLGALSLLAIRQLAWSLTESRPAAGGAVLLTLASPAFFINAASFYSMTAHLLCNACFALLLLNPTRARCWAAGMIGGLALTLHNPVPHLLFSAPWLAWLLWRRDRWVTLPAIFVGYLPMVIVVGFGWHHLVTGLQATTAAGAAGDAHPLMQALRTLTGVLAVPNDALLEARMVGLMKLWLWATPAMVLLAVVGFWRRRSDTRYRLLLASAMLTFVGYLFVPADQGHGWGFRYLHSAWFVLPLLAVAGFAPEDHESPRPVGRYLLATAIASVLVLVPYFAWQVHAFIGQHLAQLPTARTGQPRVVIISPIMQYYAQDLAQNDPYLRGPVIRMVSRGRSADAEMMAREFPQLRLLSKGYRGTVWGYAEASPADASGSTDVVRGEQRQQE